MGTQSARHGAIRIPMEPSGFQLKPLHPAKWRHWGFQWNPLRYLLASMQRNQLKSTGVPLAKCKDFNRYPHVAPLFKCKGSNWKPQGHLLQDEWNSIDIDRAPLEDAMTSIGIRNGFPFKEQGMHKGPPCNGYGVPWKSLHLRRGPQLPFIDTLLTRWHIYWHARHLLTRYWHVLHFACTRRPKWHDIFIDTLLTRLLTRAHKIIDTQLLTRYWHDSRFTCTRRESVNK